MAVGDIYKLSVLGTFGVGHMWVMTHHYRQVLGTIVDTPGEDLATQFEAEVAALLAQIISTNYVINTLEVRQITGGLEAFDLPVELPGEHSGEELPPQVCPLVKWSTGLSGRRNRGRSYFPASVETTQTAGELTTTFKTAVQNVANAHLRLGESLAPTWEKVIYGYPYEGDPTSTPPKLPRAENVALVTSAIVRNNLATQRRRRVGTGS